VSNEPYRAPAYQSGRKGGCLTNGSPNVKLRIFAIHVALPLITGIAIYLLWRSPSLLAFHWLSAIGLLEPLLLLRTLTQPLERNIPNWCLFSLPDGLWSYSLSAAILLTWQSQSSRIWVFWFTLAATLGGVTVESCVC
jgi:hypothetical protein